MVILPTPAVAGIETRLKLDECEDIAVGVSGGEVPDKDDNDSGNENIAVVVTDASEVEVSEMLSEIADIVGTKAKKGGKGGNDKGGVPLEE
jgi:hypothetical protein